MQSVSARSKLGAISLQPISHNLKSYYGHSSGLTALLVCKHILAVLQRHAHISCLVYHNQLDMQTGQSNKIPKFGHTTNRDSFSTPAKTVIQQVGVFWRQKLPALTPSNIGGPAVGA